MDESICRICLQECETLISMFTKQESSSPYQKLIGKLKLEIKKIGSSVICSQCLIELDNCIKFFDKCENANKILSFEAIKQSTSELTNDCFGHNTGNIDDISPHNCTPTENLEKTDNDKRNSEQEAEEQAPLTNKQCIECGSERNCIHKPPALYTCDMCRKVFTKKFNLAIHIKRHLGQREWPCPTCGLGQVSSWLAKRHCAPGTRYMCPLIDCAKSYTSAHNLTVHIRNHTGERPHECAECGKCFTSKTTLNDHIRIHTGSKPYMCSICGARFATNKLAAHARTHARTHSTRPPHTHKDRSQRASVHACAHCPMRYAHKQSLNRHLRKRHASVLMPKNDETTLYTNASANGFSRNEFCT